MRLKPVTIDAPRLPAEALQSAIFDSAMFSKITTDERGVIQIFNVGAEHMLGYAASMSVFTSNVDTPGSSPIWSLTRWNVG